MNIDQIKELIVILQNSHLNKLSFKDDKGCELVLEKNTPTFSSVTECVPQQSTPHVVQTAETEFAGGSYITSPMVGTFYLSPSPDEPPFIKIGENVSDHSVVCIVEAMKVLNEIKAGIKGKIVEICVDNGHPVEYGTKLFRVQ